MKIKKFLFVITTMFLMVQGASAWNGSGSSGDPYLIASTADWNTLASNVANGNTYSNTYFKLTADITVTTMVTATFSGTFDGGGHTLTFNYTATGNNAAPFAYITGATIKNLRVAGTINSGYKFAAGIVAISNGGTITNCRSSVTIASSTSGDGTHGGLVADSYTGTLNITNCLFDGKLLGTTTTSCGGIVGWHNSNSKLNISNSLFAPAEVTVQGGAIIARNGATSLTNCYYISDWSAATDQGTNANSMTATALVTALNGSDKNWCIHRGNAIPIMVNLVISTKAQWDTFAANVGNYDGKYVQLSANIGTANAPITTMTTTDTSFKGIFDGNGHTLTVNLSASSYTAPFSLLNDGTIMNLHVEGSVTVTDDYGGGLVCRTSGGDNLIDNCVVNTNVNGVSYIGGVIAHAYNAKKLTISNCVYGGTLTQSGGYIGGIFGWYNNNNNTNLNLIMHNCLFKGTYVGNGQFHPIGVKKLAATFSNLDCRDCFYTANPTTLDADRFFTDGTKVSELTIGTTGVSIASGSYATFQGTKYYYGTVTLSYTPSKPTLFYMIDGNVISGNSFTISKDNQAFDAGAVTITALPTVTTSYVDAGGTLHDGVEAVPLINTMTTLATGTYVVNSDVAYTGTVTLSGDVTLILGDDCTMSFGKEGELLNATIIECNSHNLTIYGQSGGTGWLKAYRAQDDGIHVNNYTQYSGNVLIFDGNGACIYANNSVTLLGGTLDVRSGEGDQGDISGGSISILGGKLWARNKGLWSPQGITLGYTNTTDQIYVTIYNAGGTGLEIADGKTLVNDYGEIWSGTLNNYQIGDINDRTLKPVMGVTLTKEDDNVSATFDGTSTTTVSIPVNVNVTSVTYNRTFTEGKPSTVMLPFSKDVGEIGGGTFYTFGGVEKKNNKWVATMNAVTGSLTANTPYLFVPTGTSLTFIGGATLNTTGGGNCLDSDTEGWEFHGTYSKKLWNEGETHDYGFAATSGTSADDKSVEAGQFVRLTTNASAKPMRCYLSYVGGPNQARALTRGAAATDEELPSSIIVRLVGSNGETTAIGTLDTKTGEMTFDSEAWYTLDGVRLSGKPTKKGLYINNGKKIVIK